MWYGGYGIQASHPSVSESAVVGVPHDVKGSALYCYVTLKAGCQPSDQIAAELKALVRERTRPRHITIK